MFVFPKKLSASGLLQPEKPESRYQVWVRHRLMRVYRWAMRQEKEKIAAELAGLYARFQCERRGRKGSVPLTEVIPHFEEMLPLVEDAVAVQRGRRTGVKQSAKARAAEAAEKWQRKCVGEARKLKKSGVSPRNISQILATRFGKSATQVRHVLQDAEVIEKRKRK